MGDLRTVALIGTDGTVDWYCPARFDAPSLFGALLDKNKGGYFSITARTSYAKPKQLYLPDTSILLTRFQGKDAVGEVIDFMVPETRSTGKARDLLVRQARAVRGTVTFELACHPAFDTCRLTSQRGIRWPGGQAAERLECLIMTEIVLRVRLISGDLLDVAYDGADAAGDDVMDHVTSTMAQDGGMLRCRHGDRLIVLYGRSVATLELAPRGAVL